MNTTAPVRELLDVVEQWRQEAGVLQRRGDSRAAALLEQCAGEIAGVADEYSTWLSEESAARRSGWTLTKVRRHALAFQHTPHVQHDKRTRAYKLRACIVPRRPHLEMLRAAAQQGAA